ncbi:hypothetical protein ICU_02165 [Bacillus cereus BAG2X1-1]|nr:hypothetical protein ICU_02165 [Bacillus cereus BAG2X1-1]
MMFELKFSYVQKHLVFTLYFEKRTIKLEMENFTLPKHNLHSINNKPLFPMSIHYSIA